VKELAIFCKKMNLQIRELEIKKPSSFDMHGIQIENKINIPSRLNYTSFNAIERHKYKLLLNI